MNILASIVSHGLNRFLCLLHRTILMSLLIGLIWLPVLSLYPVLAASNDAIAGSEDASKTVGSTTAQDARMLAFIDCLPKQLSQANFSRSMGDMGNDQLERMFNLKPNPKLSKAEVELKSCLSSKGFT
jgi:hypothetical protein